MSTPTRIPEPVVFRWASYGVAGLTALSLIVFVISRGFGDLGLLAIAAFAVWFTKLSIFATDLPAALGSDQLEFNPWQLSYIAWVLDLWAAVLLARIRRFDRVPRFGQALQRAQNRSVEVLRTYPGIRRLAFWGVFLYVFIPFPASGAVTGTLIARLVGLSRSATLLSVGSGAGIAVIMYAALAVFLGQQWRAILESPWLAAAILVLIVVLGWWGWKRVRRELKRK